MVFVLQVTESCNLNCRYCFEGEKGREYMRQDMIPAVISFIGAYMGNAFIVDKRVNINFNGGEPLLNFDFIKAIVRELKKIDIFSYSISTNFTVVNDEIMLFLVNNKFQIQISLDGSAPSHNHNRTFYDGSGSFDTAYNNILKYKSQLQACDTAISMVVTPETVKDMCHNINFIYESGLTKITPSMCLDYNWPDDAIREYETQVEQCAELYKKSYDTGNVLRLSLFDGLIETTIQGLSKPDCGACKDVVSVIPNGDLFPCGVFMDRIDKNSVIGSVYSGVSLDKTARYLNPNTVDISSCENCQFLNRCQNKCFAHNYRITGDIRKGAERYCWVNKKLIMASDDILDYLLKSNNPSFLKQYKNILGE
jgi:uncharacterized protein